MTHVPTRTAYYEGLVDETFRDDAEMREGFMAWAERHVPIWRSQGQDEAWIRLRIESARSCARLCQDMRGAGLTPGQQRKRIREALLASHEVDVDLYQLMLMRTGDQEPQHWGVTDDLVRRYTLRVLLHDTEQRCQETFHRWADLPPEPFQEPDDVRVVRDLSGVEELQLQLALTNYKLQILEQGHSVTLEELMAQIDAWATQARTSFIARNGFSPEEASVPFTPVTTAWPVDHDDYYASLRATAEQSS
jgi:hypothetical protein